MDFLRGYAAFLDHRYWLNFHPVPLGPSLVSSIFTFFLWFIVVAVALRIVARAIRKKEPPMTELLRRFSTMLATTGFLGWLALFFAYEQLPLFGMRLWFLVVFIVFVVWLVRCVLYAVRDYPAQKKALEEKRRLEKYMPKKK